MVTIPVLDDKGKEVSSVTLAQEFLVSTVSAQVLKDAIVAHRANQRRGTACTKTKSEVNFSGAKPWKQKGTGRARSGERSSPIWRKGAVAFGPRPHSFHKTVNKKVKKAALHSILANKLVAKQIILIDKIALESPKTKLLVSLLATWKAGSNALILTEKGNKNVELAARNIPGVAVETPQTVSTYDLMCSKMILLTPQGLDQLKLRSAAGKEAS